MIDRPKEPATEVKADVPNVGFVLAALALGGFALGTTEFAAMALVPYFSAELKISEAQASVPITAYALGVVFGAPAVAALGARMRRKTLLVGLMIAFAVFNLGTALAEDFTTLNIARFLSGLPHGAYFGIASIVAAGLVPRDRRASAMSRVMIGLTLATTTGVPLSNVLGQTIGWRWGFAIVALLAALTAVSVFMLVPRDEVPKGANLQGELGALRNKQVLLTLATAAVGSGGFFAVYTYIASTMLTEMQAPGAMVPVALMVMGMGMIAGAVIGGWAADRSPTRAGFALMGVSGALLCLYPAATFSLPTYLVVLFGIGTTTSVPMVLQTRLLDFAGESQQMAVSLSASAFNIANAIGPWLASLAIGAGFGFAQSGYVGVLLTLTGISIFAWAVLDARSNPAPQQ